MPIEISCHSCSKRLRVPDNAAGKRVKCPGCQTILNVPAGGDAPAGPAPTAAKSNKEAEYHLKTEDGQTFGPVPKSEMDEWVTEGRVISECQLLKDGEDQWQWASDVYPQLAQDETVPSSGGGDGGFAGIDVGGSGSSGGSEDNPFAFAASGTAGASGGGKAVAKKGSTGSVAAEGESDKSKMVAGLLGLFLGWFGAGRFYLGYTGLGVAQLLTCGGCGWWSLIDAIFIFTGKVTDAKGRPLKD